MSEQIEALRAEIEEMDALLNRQGELLRQTAIALRGPEPDLTRYSHADIPARATTAVAELDALRAENERLNAQFNECARLFVDATEQACKAQRERDALAVELEAAQGLLRDMRHATRVSPSCQAGIVSPCRCMSCVDARTDAFLTATPTPVVRDHIEQHLEMAEQGERQEAACWVPRACLDKLRNGCNNSPAVLTDGPAEFNDTPLYTIPQPGQDVRGLAASLYQACSAYDMPERILDALSAAASGEPFAHMIDALLPCVPPSDQDVQSLVEALEECAASLAWNCFGECRAIHAGPIMPAAKALDTARAALSTHRQAQPQ